MCWAIRRSPALSSSSSALEASSSRRWSSAASASEACLRTMPSNRLRASEVDLLADSSSAVRSRDSVEVWQQYCSRLSTHSSSSRFATSASAIRSGGRGRPRCSAPSGTSCNADGSSSILAQWAVRNVLTGGDVGPSVSASGAGSAGGCGRSFGGTAEPGPDFRERPAEVSWASRPIPASSLKRLSDASNFSCNAPACCRMLC
mmetsp:Transcript_53993/g.97212  ORF Transcript_53993/g.97212 Transcript_53993/m.97212 type:complete len:203 (+) Transcript_53993:1333-1941(+)